MFIIVGRIRAATEQICDELQQQQQQHYTGYPVYKRKLFFIYLLI
jgi:hypothetical protein